MTCQAAARATSAQSSKLQNDTTLLPPKNVIAVLIGAKIDAVRDSCRKIAPPIDTSSMKSSPTSLRIANEWYLKSQSPARLPHPKPASPDCVAGKILCSAQQQRQRGKPGHGVAGDAIVQLHAHLAPVPPAYTFPTIRQWRAACPTNTYAAQLHQHHNFIQIGIFEVNQPDEFYIPPGK
ncbi:MAG TPA: hypothetical protein VIF60_15615 [Burkholderiaceae bacterium]